MDTTLAHPLPAPVTLRGWTRGLPVFLAVAGTGVTMALAYLLAIPESRPAELLLGRGYIQLLTLALFFWGLGHVLRRWLVQQGERRALDACRRLLHRSPTREDVPRYIEALRPLGESLSGPVLSGVLSYFRSQRPTRDEVLEVAGKAVDRAYDRVESDYRALGAVLWLIPLSGFLGTVVGMAEAIGAFDLVITQMGDELTALIPAVSGLAKAFDTTLLALALVVPLKLLEVGIQGRDRQLLEDIDTRLGHGLVADLDLAILAQHNPAQEALDRTAETAARIEHSLRRIDAALGSLADRIEDQPLLKAAQALPAIQSEVEALRRASEKPLVLKREE